MGCISMAACFFVFIVLLYLCFLVFAIRIQRFQSLYNIISIFLIAYKRVEGRQFVSFTILLN